MTNNKLLKDEEIREAWHRGCVASKDIIIAQRNIAQAQLEKDEKRFAEERLVIETMRDQVWLKAIKESHIALSVLNEIENALFGKPYSKSLTGDNKS